MDFGLSQADMESIQGGLDPSGATGGVAPSQQDQDNYAQASANILAEPIAGRSRSNITNDPNYDPTFAAAFDISRGLDPTNNFGGTGGLAVPSYLRPQTPGNLILNEAGDRMMYGSPVERFAQETAPEFIRGIQKVGIGGLLNTISEAFTDAKRAIGLDGGAQGGLKVEDLQPTMGTLDPSDRFLGDMSQQGAGISVTDPVVTTPNVAMGTIPQVSPLFDQFGNPYRTRADRNAAEMAQQSLSGGIASVAPNMAQDANIQVADASQFLNPQAISRGLNYFAGPQIQDFFKGVTNNPNATIRLGPGFDMEKQKVDDNIFSINIPFATG